VPFVETGLIAAETHHPGSVTVQWEEIYAEFAGTAAASCAGNFRPLPSSMPKKTRWHRLLSHFRGNPVCFDYVPRVGPWGGGNQFLGALAKALQTRGWRVRFGRDRGCPVILLNSFHSQLIESSSISGKRYVHRIDGPTVLIRGKDGELDREVFRINNQVASVTVMQSEWSLYETLRLGFHPVNPVLIHNAADPTIFYPASEPIPLTGRKIRLISTSWSDNPRKGGQIYKWLDDNLDWSRYEYTFVGRVSESLRNIRVVAPLPSRDLAAMLREHDIYITASDNDPCSNALIEAMSCGLPTIYYDRGGHPELVGFCGLGFDSAEEIPVLLEALAADYSAFRRLVVVPTLADVSKRYAECFTLAGGS